MNLSKLFDMQRALDAYIEREHGLEQADLFDKKALALLVETGELANETRCFKFWSKKGSSEQSVILEEFVDGVHFVLSLGLLLKFEQETEWTPAPPAETATAQFLRVYEAITQFMKEKSLATYLMLFNDYFALGRMLGFTAEEVEKAYIAKNEVNYRRQQQGY
ncbi:dUTP diphosphatase [Bacillus xiapuensis]|uniref:dUTP diphosphatase n=1 Tax=Bacillus xiapuensis TaxID=2014075 RepID=UPI000C250CB7|nr:dUTP diphosphatase [Bacillus xiapuensis]